MSTLVPTPPPSSNTQSANFPTYTTPTHTPDSNPNPDVVSTITLTSISVYTSVTVSTAPNGAILTTTLSSTVVIVPSILPVPSSGGGRSSGSGSSNNGAIIGGIAGGVSAVLVALILGLFYWCRNRRPEVVNGTINPNRVTPHTGRTDLMGAEVTPYRYEPEVARTTSSHSVPVSPTWSGDSSMRHSRESQALLSGSILEAGGATATSESHHSPTSSDGASGYPASSHAHSSSSRSRTGFGPGFPASQPYRPMSIKERESLRQRGRSSGFDLASALEEGEEEIIQHSDGGGVVPVVVTSPQEIPPSYDSIPGNAK